MQRSSFLDFDNCVISNELWPIFIEKIGIDRALKAIRQTIDLQHMQGSKYTLPVLIVEVVSKYTGLSSTCLGSLLLYSSKEKQIQLLKEA